MKRILFQQKALLHVFLIFCIVAEAKIAHGQFSQKLLSESWVKSGGQGLAYKNVSVTDVNRNVYVAGATMSGNNNSDIIVQKISHAGVLLWEQTFAGTAGMNDAATALFIDASSNVYITGTVVNSAATDQDLIVLKYNSSGELQWNYTFDGGASVYKQDAGTSIVGLTTGARIFVTGTSGNDNTLFNFKTICLTSSGVVSWTQTYDYNALVEIPKRIVINGANVNVVGASQQSATRWEMATVSYNYTTGAFVSAVRSNSSTVAGIKEINDVAVDHSSGDTYLIGALENPATGFDVAVYKLDNSLNLVWQHYYDMHGLEDKGTGIEVVSGNVYLTGYSTKPGFGKETLLMKLSGSGTVAWKREISGAKDLDDKGEQIIVDGSNRLYIASSVNDGNQLDYKLYCYDLNGNYLAATSYNGASNLNDVPQSIEIDLDNNVILTGYEQTGPSTYITKIVKYAFFERSYDFAYTNKVPTHLQGTVLVKFKQNAMNLNAMNSRKYQAGALSEFIDGTTLSQIQTKTGIDWSRFKTYKMFKFMAPVDTISITRLGNTIKTEDFWTFLSIDVPNTWNINTLCDSLSTLTTCIREADPDFICELYSTPDDPLYNGGQLSLYPNATYPNSDINLEDAWDVEVGQSNIKVGVLDAPINWAHEEFNNGEANIPGAGQKVGGGYNYYLGSEIHLGDQWVSYDHGTAVAGIIGAKRNNNPIGIAGIAGGDMSVGNFGVQLFSLGISGNSTAFAPYSVIAEALRNAYTDSPSDPHNFGLNLINGSWGTTVGPYPVLGDQIKECWRNHCIYVAARGQYDTEEDNFPVWPACFNDLHVINVMASGKDGGLKTLDNQNGSGNWNSNYGLSGANNTLGCPADLLAPGVTELVTTTMPFNTYGPFSGTSAAAPHVAGVAALMYSRHQTGNGFPNKLATEDIERVMEKTAVDKGAPGFDLQSGYGLLDAKKAIQNVSGSYYIKHLTATPTYNVSNIAVDVVYNPNGTFAAGLYPNSKRYLVTWDIDVYLPGGHQIIDWWELEAATVKGFWHNSSSTWSGFTPYLSTSMAFDPIGGTHVHKTATSAVYLVNVGNDANPANDFWYPMSPSQLKYEFSIHVKKSAIAGVEEVSSANFELYPNPSNQQITINTKLATTISSYEIVDATGRVVGKESKINSTQFTVDIVSLTQGVYYCRVFSDNSVETLPFIKTKE